MECCSALFSMQRPSGSNEVHHEADALLSSPTPLPVGLCLSRHQVLLPSSVVSKVIAERDPTTIIGHNTRSSLSIFLSLSLSFLLVLSKLLICKQTTFFYLKVGQPVTPSTKHTFMNFTFLQMPCFLFERKKAKDYGKRNGRDQHSSCSFGTDQTGQER